MRYTVVRNDQGDGRQGLMTSSFEDKRELKEWIVEVGLDVNQNDFRAGRNIHVGNDGEEYVIFKGDPVRIVRGPWRILDTTVKKS